MPKEIFPSSFECDCGHQSDFSERTVREIKAMSQKKRVSLGDAAPEEHTIVFYKGKMVEILCPKQPENRETKRRDTTSSLPKRSRTKPGIPDEVKTHVEAAVKQFNTTEIRDPHCGYVPR